MKGRCYKVRYLMSGNSKGSEGETIETKVARIVQNKEPITDGAPMIYTEKEQGVLPEYDIRTDKWEIAQNAMDVVHATNIAKSKELSKENKEEKPVERNTQEQ
nr:MAG TPA: hypothetical protein [Microviridae sp.]